MNNTDKSSNTKKLIKGRKHFFFITLSGITIGIICGKLLGYHYENLLDLEVKNFFGFLALATLFYSLNSYTIKTKLKASENYKYYLLI